MLFFQERVKWANTIAIMKIDPQKTKDNLKNYARYSNLALQMGTIIAAGIFGGYWLDKTIQWKFPVFTVLMAIVSVALAIYIAIRDLLKK